MNADRGAFDPGDLGKKTWCGKCKTNWPVKEWQCKCLLPWHQCQVHRSAPLSSRAFKKAGLKVEKSSARYKDEPKIKRKRLQSEPVRVLSPRKRCSDICFASSEVQRPKRMLQANFMSVGLKRKFSHLL